jgi:hypothetical protein
VTAFEPILLDYDVGGVPPSEENAIAREGVDKG